MRLRVLSAVLFFAVALPLTARAEDDEPAIAAAAVTALRASHPDEAIANFEALADRGVTDATVSFDRGLAYALRVRLGGEVPGDLGRAVHGFEEARVLGPGPLADEANQALSVVRSEIAHRRTRGGEPMPMEQGLSPLRSLSGLAREGAWGVLLLVAAAVEGLALFGAWLLTSRRPRVAAVMTAGLALVATLAFSVMVLAARHDRLYYREAVVVVPSARLADARGVVQGQGAEIPEGAKVRVVDESGGLVHIVWGDSDGWISAERVRRIATAS